MGRWTWTKALLVRLKEAQFAPLHCHCEERSDAAISGHLARDCRVAALLAMTVGGGGAGQSLELSGPAGHANGPGPDAVRTKGFDAEIAENAEIAKEAKIALRAKRIEKRLLCALCVLGDLCVESLLANRDAPDTTDEHPHHLSPDTVRPQPRGATRIQVIALRGARGAS